MDGASPKKVISFSAEHLSNVQRSILVIFSPTVTLVSFRHSAKTKALKAPLLFRITDSRF